jgi:TetR/AcrR family transcriptional repressor of lmrAB and yxaGH operons
MIEAIGGKMMKKSSNAKEKLVETTSRLLQHQGYHATGLNQIIKESKTPKGSLYYYFPNGKEELVSEAVRCSRDFVAERIREGLAQHDDPVLAIQALIQSISESFESEERYEGVPVAAVVLETAMKSTIIREACHEAYNTWHQAFAEKLLQDGYSDSRAKTLARVINVMIEGAIILSLARQDSQALHDVAQQIPILLELKN